MPDPLPILKEAVPTEEHPIEAGSGLCLSGGGYRAMVFHLGVLIRLNEVGLLGRLKRVSSVSGGSITAGVLGMNWSRLQFDANRVASRASLNEFVIDPIQRLAEITIDAGAVLGGLLNPFTSISDEVVHAYRKHLFGDKTLADLPSDEEGPRFVINATNVQSGAVWRFSRPFMGDWKVGRIFNPKVPLAAAVTASSAFPPVLSPVELAINSTEFAADPDAILQMEGFAFDKVVLSDGGVYDNMGMETVWKRLRTIFVSDAGAPFTAEAKPASDWMRHSLRVLDLIDNQVRSLRRREIIAALRAKTEHEGAYWNIRTELTDLPKPGALEVSLEEIKALAATPTRLATLERPYQDRLINWGYAVSAAALESYHPGPVSCPAAFPCP